LSFLWLENHNPVCLAKVYYVALLNARRHCMYHLVLSNVETSMGISLVVWDELAIQVLVVPTQQYVSGLEDAQQMLYVIASDVEWVGIICQNRQEAEG